MRSGPQRTKLDGIVVREATYAPWGFPVGDMVEFYRTGEVRRTRTFPAAGGSAVSDVSWYRNGQLKYRRCCPRATATGFDEKFWEDGTPRMRGEWRGGRRVGPWVWWDPEGVEWFRAEFVLDACIEVRLGTESTRPVHRDADGTVYDQDRRPLAHLEPEWERLADALAGPVTEAEVFGGESVQHLTDILRALQARRSAGG